MPIRMFVLRRLRLVFLRQLPKLTAAVVLLQLGCLPGLQASDGLRRANIADAVRNVSGMYKVPAFNSFGVSGQLDSSGEYFVGSDSIVIIDLSKYKLLATSTENTVDLHEIGERNISLYRQARAKKARLTGALVLESAGVSLAAFVEQFEKNCDIDVVWKAAVRDRTNLWSGSVPMKTSDACELFVWAISAQRLKFELNENRQLVLHNNESKGADLFKK